MGLDISASGDYIRFNWSGCQLFSAWCFAERLPNPFPCWGGDNSGDQCNLNNSTHRGHAQEWLDAFRAKYPRLAEMGPGESVQQTMYALAQIHWQNPTAEQRKVWEQYTALAWYRFLEDKIESRETFGYY